MIDATEVEKLGASEWLDELVATQVMGWKADKDLGLWRDSGGLATRPLALWRPSSDEGDAMLVFDYIREAKGWHWALEWIHPWEQIPEGAWYVWAEAWPTIPCDVDEADRVLQVTGPTIALTICRAAVALVS